MTRSSGHRSPQQTKRFVWPSGFASSCSPRFLPLRVGRRLYERLLTPFLSLEAGEQKKSGSLLSRGANPESAWFSRDDGSRLKVVAVKGQDAETQDGLLLRGLIDKSDHAGMWEAEHDGQFSEVFVEGDQDAFFAMGTGQDLLIAGVVGPVACPRHIVSGCSQLCNGATPDTGIQQQLHGAVSESRGSIRSCPTRRWA